MDDHKATAGRAPAPRAVLVAVLAALVIASVELLSAAVWKVALDHDQRATIKALCGATSGPPQKVPNALWHHDLNREHPLYKGVVNPKGTKGKDFALPKPPGELRIICIGDSSVEGIGVEPDETWRVD